MTQHSALSTQQSVLVRGGLVCQPDLSFRRADVLVEGDTIVAVGDLGERAGPTIDATRRLVMPGLVNAHLHSGENYNKALYENLPLELWFLYSHQVLGATPLRPREIYVRTLLGCIEQLKTGTTTAVDFLFEAPSTTPEGIDAVMQAYEDVGMRANLILGMADKPLHQTVPMPPELIPRDLLAALDTEPLPGSSEWIALSKGALARWHGVDGRLAIGLGPSGPQRCTDRFLHDLFDLAEQRDLVFHTHCLETKLQAVSSQIYYGKGLVAHCEDLGILAPRTSLIHAIWLTDDDIARIAAHGTATIHCLLSNLKLGDGVMRVPKLLEAGVPIALGTDGKGCDDCQDLFELMKMTALIHKVHDPRYERWLTAAQTFQMATRHGARCAGLGATVGTIAPGQKADLVLLDLEALPFQPLNQPLFHLVYAQPGPAVHTVLVGGRVVLEGGRLLGVPEEAIWAEAREIHRRLAPGYQQVAALANRLVPSTRAAYERAASVDVGVDCYIQGPGGQGVRGWGLGAGGRESGVEG